jgi:pimeloyl-ACP methyl ester carboxylesterase
MPRVEFCSQATTGLFADLTERLPALEASLPSITVPFGVLVGGRSPMPPSAGTESAAHIPGAWSVVVPGAGHFVWHEAPGCVVAAVDRLVAESAASPKVEA